VKRDDTANKEKRNESLEHVQESGVARTKKDTGIEPVLLHRTERFCSFIRLAGPVHRYNRTPAALRRSEGSPRDDRQGPARAAHCHPMRRGSVTARR
jgi:hypothetical protein